MLYIKLYYKGVYNIIGVHVTIYSYITFIISIIL